MVTPEFPPACGGIGYYVHSLAKELRRKGTEVEVFVRGGKGRGEFEGVPFERLPVMGVPPFNNPSFARSVERRPAFRTVDLVHIHGSSMPLIGDGLPRVVTSHWCIREGTRPFYRRIDGAESLYRNLMFHPFCIAEERLVRGCDAFTVVSPSMRDDYRRDYGIEGEVVFNGVGGESLSRPEVPRKFSVVCVASLKWGKGLVDLLKAVPLVTAAFPPVSIHLYGEGYLRGGLERMVRRMGAKNVQLHGDVGHEELLREVASASVLVLPSYYEGLPNSILEAMACATPVVATRVRGNAELVADGVNGLLCEPSDPRGLADAIVALLGDPARARKMGRNGRRIAREKYTWDRVADRFIGIYEKTTERKCR
jgi:glycosyltransferase involved in cell wall biosynthesis